MPNWCMNNVSVSHEDPEMMLKFKAALETEKLFETFVPNPTGQWDYGWSVENWGTKWDNNGGDFTLDADNKSGSGFFDTAWGPPISFYEKLKEQGFVVEATYFEPGMCFAGAWSDGVDESYEYDFSDPDWAEDIDNDDVRELLESEYESWLEWNDEEEYDDDSEGEVSTEESGESSK